MRIAALDFLGVNVTPKTNWCFVVLRLEDGRSGIGEITLSDHEALLEAEVLLNVNDPVALIDGLGVYDLPVAGAEDRWNDTAVQWLSATALDDQNTTNAVYLIEYMGDWPYPPECADVASKDKISVGCLSPTFRITARTVSDNGRAAVMLQSLFRR